MSKKEALIDLLTQAAEYCLPSNTEESHIEMLADFICNDVEIVRIRVPKGEKQAAWIIVGGSFSRIVFECSACGMVIEPEQGIRYPARCPACEAYMTKVKFGKEQR